MATVAVPKRENTAPNTLPQTARKMTVLDWSRVLKTASLSRGHVNCP